MKCSDKDIGKRIAQLRKEYKTSNGKKLTQDDLATAVGLSRTIIAKIESGIQPLTPVQLYDISKFFGVSSDYIVSGVSSENTTVSDELGLTQNTIIKLKEMKERAYAGGKEHPDTIDHDVLYAVNMLLGTSEGANVLTNICHYLITDFDRASYQIDETWVDEEGDLRHYGEANKQPIERLFFERAVMYHGRGIEIECKLFSYALLQAINSGLKTLRDKVIAMEGTPYDKRKEIEERELKENDRIEWEKWENENMSE